MIIDCHCHVGRGDLMTDPWNTDAPLKMYLKRAYKAGIAKTVVFAPFHSDYAVANAEVAQIVARRPGQLIGFAFVHAKRDAGRIHVMVEQAVLRWGFRGIKVHGADGLPGREICQVAAHFRIPVLVDVVGKAHVIEMLASRYPQVDFIIPHLGSFSDDWKAQQTVCDQLVRYPNVYADTSGVRRFDYIVQAVERAGAAKLLFGSDAPWLHPALELQKIRLLELPPPAENLILGGNIQRLLAKLRLPQAQPASWNALPPQREVSVMAEAATQRDYEL